MANEQHESHKGNGAKGTPGTKRRREKTADEQILDIKHALTQHLNAVAELMDAAAELHVEVSFNVMRGEHGRFQIANLALTRKY